MVRGHCSKSAMNHHYNQVDTVKIRSKVKMVYNHHIKFNSTLDYSINLFKQMTQNDHSNVTMNGFVFVAD